MGLEFHGWPFDVEAFMRSRGAGITAGGFDALRVVNEAFCRAITSQFQLLSEVAEGADRIVSAGLNFAGASVASKL